MNLRIKYAIVLLLLCFSVVSSAQYSKTASLTGGIYGDGYGGEFTFNTMLNDRSFTQIALNGTYTNFKNGEVDVPYLSVTGSYSYFFTVLTLRSRRIFQQSLSVGGGALVGYESVNNGQVELTNIVSVAGKSKLIFGGVVSLDYDIIISEYFSLVLKTSEAYHANSDFGKFTNYSGIGLRYYLE